MKLVLASLLGAALATGAAAAAAQPRKADPADAAAVASCLKRAGEKQPETCIGAVSDRCLEKPDGQSTAGMAACLNREHLVWDDMLNGVYDQLRKSLADVQWAKLQEGQRVWLEARKRSCEFYWEFFRGTVASPMAEGCYMRETANRALYLRFFLNHTKK